MDIGIQATHLDREFCMLQPKCTKISLKAYRNFIICMFTFRYVIFCRDAILMARVFGNISDFTR